MSLILPNFFEISFTCKKPTLKKNRVASGTTISAPVKILLKKCTFDNALFFYWQFDTIYQNLWWFCSLFAPNRKNYFSNRANFVLVFRMVELSLFLGQTSTRNFYSRLMFRIQYVSHDITKYCLITYFWWFSELNIASPMWLLPVLTID